MIIMATDGSSRPVPKGMVDTKIEKITGAGTIIYNSYSSKIIQLKKSLADETHNYAELYSILQGLEALKEEINDFKAILILADSEYSIKTLNNYMLNMAKNDWKKSDGSKPKNLKLLKRIYELTVVNNKVRENIKYLHINSHLPNNDKSLRIIRDKFMKHGINIDNKVAKIVIEINAIADALANEAGRECLQDLLD
jgi:ribonuclease HI